MRITWVTRSFLDYRIPVYSKLNKLCGNNLTVIYYRDVVPERCQEKLAAIIGERAIGLSGEIRFGGQKMDNQSFANQGGLRIPLRPGLFNQLKKTRPDIVFSDGFFQWSYAALMLNAFYGIPNIMCYERTPHTERNVTLIRTIARKLAAKFISGICCNGVETKAYLKSFGFPVNKLFMGNMAADTEGLKLGLSKVNDSQIRRMKEKFEINGDVFLYVGQLIPRKGIMELLETWRTFSSNMKPTTLLIVGDGEQFQEVKDYVREHDLTSVKVMGRVDYSEVSTIYALSDIFIIPTLEDNWSLVVPEAMSCGLPILSSKYNGCWPEFVQASNGWVFDPLDKNSFTETLETAVRNRENWTRMGEASRKIVEDFSPDRIASGLYGTSKLIMKHRKKSGVTG